MAVPAPRPLLPALLVACAVLAGCETEHAPLAVQSPCPAWVDYPADRHINDGSPYLGCTNRANLDQMLDDKQDLVAGRALGPADGERESKVIKDYQTGKTKTSNAGATTPGAALLIPETGRTGTQ